MTNKKIPFLVELEFADSIPQDLIPQVGDNLLDAIISAIEGQGIAPEREDEEDETFSTFTTGIKVSNENHHMESRWYLTEHKCDDRQSAIADLFDTKNGIIIVESCNNHIKGQKIYRSTSHNFHGIQTRLAELADVAQFSYEEDPNQSFFFWKTPKSITILVRFLSFAEMFSQNTITELDVLFEKIENNISDELGDTLLP